MKILHVIRSVDPHWGGPVEAIRQHGTAMCSVGHEVEVASMDAPDEPWLKEFPIHVHALGPSSGTYGFSKSWGPWLRRHSDDYDVIIINGIWQYHSFGTWRILRETRTPYVIFPHGMLDPWFKQTYPLKHIKKWLYWPWADYRVLRDASAVLFTCEEERLLARESFWLYRCNEVVVKFGTSKPSGDPQVQVSQFLQAFPQLRGKRLLLFMGRIHPKKGCDLLIDAFAQTAASDPDYHLVIAGPDQVGRQAKLSARAAQLGIAERLTWTGMISGDLKWGAFRSAEAFVLPSHQENFGIVVAEALACGLPALISNKVNIWREIQQDRAGIVSNDNLAGTCSLLRSWMKMPDRERKEMRGHALRCFEERFEVNQAAESLVRVLADVAPQAHGISNMGTAPQELI